VEVVTAAVVMAVADTAAAADISVEVMAEAGATALAACISAVVTTPVRGSPSHIQFRGDTLAASILLPVKA
jgi:phosphoribosylcarboxyaminoimidazole (NCAIR) mutase